MENKGLWFLIFMLIGCSVLWLIGTFITLDMLWFWNTVIGRVIGLFFFIIVLGSSIKEVDEF
jgi:type VI protein secretion system component VasK